MELEEERVEQLTAAAAVLEERLSQIEERLAVAGGQAGEVERISATVEQSRREEELAARVVGLERALEELKAQAAAAPSAGLRKTVPVATAEMLAKRGIGDGPVDVRSLDAALAGLSLEQRIAVKTQLLRAGAIGSEQ